MSDIGPDGMFNFDPLGDFTLLFTGAPGDDRCLMTDRYKDRDVTPDQLRAISAACLRAAEIMETGS